VGWCLLPQFLFVLWGVGAWGGQWWTALPVVFLLLVVPALDWLTGWQDDGRFERSDLGAFERALLRWNVRLYALLQMVTIITLMLSFDRWNAIEIGFLLGSASLMSAVGFAAAHELLHAPSRIDRTLQAIFTSFLFYPHYKLIHVYSHHVHVSTELDENTAWRGEGIYHYLWRTVPGSMRRCWALEWKRMLIYLVSQALVLAGAFLLAGVPGLLFYVAHLVGAHVLLESVNYIQHYGLLRAPAAEAAKFERTGPQHSWDTYHWFSSYVTFRTGHHANHHVSAGPYYLLAPEIAAPKLPVGYFWAIPLVLLPPWWRSTIRAVARG
jgi:alkane 1-monooxygenase